MMMILKLTITIIILYVSCMYPVLFTSNSWPREVAVKGKVKFSEGAVV